MFNKFNLRYFLFLIIIISIILISLNFISAADCWQYTANSTCAADSDCSWKSDSWGGWCQELSCWGLYTQTDCQNTVVPGKNCSWSAGGTTYSCEDISCWSFSGTSNASCEGNSAGLNCQWKNYCYTDGYNSGIDCWSINNQATCGNTTGCKWGQCEQKNCWNYNSNPTCSAGKDWSGNNCTWTSSGGSEYCTENGCWNYNTNASCANAAGINCEWKWNSCQQIDCWSWDFTNANTCINNSLNLSCEWSGSYCNKKSCWNYGETECSANPKCNWRAWSSSGWCEQLDCWSWDSWSGGSQSACVGNSSNYGLSCAWQNMSADGTGWCFKDFSSTSCSNITNEKACMDTYYCWWQYNDWNNVSAGGNCSDPYGWGMNTNTSIMIEWNPGCYAFDMNTTDCGSVLGCDNLTAGVCSVNATHDNANEINTNGINCSMINSSQLCNNIPMLSSCCIWNNGTCAKRNEIDPSSATACWDQMQQKSENSCGDAKTKGKCDEISNYPWYMPCQWTNSTETCDFKSGDVFGNGSQSLVLIDNQKSCEAAGGKWVVENYCEGSVSVPTGRCEYKFDDEDNCDKACFACEKKDSNKNTVNATNAESACIGSKLGFCGFIADTNAPNRIGYCKAKEQFKKGIVSDCDSNCGDCTYLGTSTSNDTQKRPSYFCGNSKANSVEGGCKWITDNSTNTGGYCINKGEKTCQDSCDRCSTQTKCTETGRTAIANQSGSCKWQGDSDTGSCVANIAGDVEVCWDGVDNTNDGLIDCADSGCYADSYCGFVSGDCFGWTNNNTCLNNGCEWIVDKWGSWCDFKGSQCWNYGTNDTTCNAQTNCQWSNGTGSGWCEKDWSSAEICMGLNQGNCMANNASGCNWTVDSWCVSGGNATSWCQDNGGWCDHTDFAPKNCWMYQSGSSECNSISGCSWHTDQYATSYCEVNWSGNCWNYYDSNSCESGGCAWRSDSWGGWCDNLASTCWAGNHTQSSCQAVSGNKCVWKNESWGAMCEPACFSQQDLSSCSAIGGGGICNWKAESGWCEESSSCWNLDQTGCTNQTGIDATCRWKNPGWCDPKGGGFSTGAIAGGGGVGTAIGADCYKYDGNQTLCTNKTIINISCGWMPETNPRCEVNWGGNCWQYNSSTVGLGCNVTNGCWWNSEFNYCTNLMDQCWNNMTLTGNSTLCNENAYCNATSWGGCEPTCYSTTSSSGCGSGCKWVTGWCNPAGMNNMFDNMEGGAPAPLGTDVCNEITEPSQASVDICGFGMKDMIDSYGFGLSVNDFSNASICNKEKLSSFVMGMIGGAGGAYGGAGSGSLERIGDGNDTIKFFIYLDTDGSTSGGCTLSHNSSATGYEFRFKYVSEWNATKAKAVETFNAYKCDNSVWKVSDIKLNTYKKKMCSEIGGPMIAVEKADLERFPTLYDSTKDIRVVVATAGVDNNITIPSDTTSPGWTTPGSVDFEINSAFSYGADTAKFEDILRKGFVEYEDCFDNIDNDGDGNIDCNDWSCENADKCNNTGVNAPGYVDTTTPLITGVKIEEYTDSALIMYDTNKPANGTLEFYYNDSTCLNLNTSIYDIGTINNKTREHKLWHTAQVYNGVNSLSYNLTNNTVYYYKLRVCDSGGKCALSKCSSFTTPSMSRCGYCNFVTRIKAPVGWEVNYDLDKDGNYEHAQGKVCGPNAGMKTNYTSGRSANIKLNKTDGSVYFEFINVTITKSGLNDKVRTINNVTSLIYNTTNDYVGMPSETRDKIINNLHPEVCRIKIPFTGTCNALYHCNDTGGDCVDKTNEATLIDSANCVWEVPYCQFSTYDEDISVPVASTDTSSGGGGGGGGGSIGTTYEITETEFNNGYTKELSKNDKIKFVVDNENHTITLNTINNITVKITVKSETQEATLKVGDIRRFDVDENGEDYDLSVRLISISADKKKASLMIKAISESITEKTLEEESEKEKKTEDTEVGGKKVQEDEKKGLNWLWILIVLVIIGIIIGIWYLIKRNK